jgi:hypothetical protein
MRGRPSRSLTFGSHPSSSFAFVIFGFLWRGSSGVFSTIEISTAGLISCGSHNKALKFPCFLNLYLVYVSWCDVWTQKACRIFCFQVKKSNKMIFPCRVMLVLQLFYSLLHVFPCDFQAKGKRGREERKRKPTSLTVSASSSIVNSP